MAVPSSGSISMRGLAREKVYDNYSSTSTPTGPYSMYDLVNGGSTNGSGTSFDTTNTSSSSYPNTTAPHAMSEWRSYDHDASSVSYITMTLYLDNYISTSSNYLQVYVDGTLYQVTNGNTTSVSVSVPASSSISISAYAEDTSGGGAYLELYMYDEYSLFESDSGTNPSVSFNYTTPSAAFNMYAETFD